MDVGLLRGCRRSRPLAASPSSAAEGEPPLLPRVKPWEERPPRRIDRVGVVQPEPVAMLVDHVGVGAGREGSGNSCDYGKKSGKSISPSARERPRVGKFVRALARGRGFSTESLHQLAPELKRCHNTVIRATGLNRGRAGDKGNRHGNRRSKNHLTRLLDAIKRSDGPRMAREMERLEELLAQGARPACIPSWPISSSGAATAKALMFLGGETDIPVGALRRPAGQVSAGGSARFPPAWRRPGPGPESLWPGWSSAGLPAAPAFAARAGRGPFAGKTAGARR